MKFIEWLFGTKCDACGQRTRSKQHVAKTTGVQQLLCDDCHDKLLAEQKHQEERNRKEAEARKTAEAKAREEARLKAEAEVA